MNGNAVGQQAHHGGGFNPGYIFELLFSLVERNKKDIASNICAHHVHDLSACGVLHSRDLDVVARIDSKAPRGFAITRGGHSGAHQRNGDASERRAVNARARTEETTTAALRCRVQREVASNVGRARQRLAVAAVKTS